MTPFIKQFIERRNQAITIDSRAFVSIPLLLVIMISISSGLGHAIRGLSDELGLLGIYSLIGLIAGWRIGSGIAGWKRGVFWGLLAVPFIFISSGHLWLSGVGAIRSGAFFVAKYFSIWILYLKEQFPTDLIPSITPLSISWSQFSAAVSNHLGEISRLIENLLLGNPSFLPGAVTFLWGLVLWALSFYTAWALRAHNRLFLSVLPGGILMTSGMSIFRAKDTDSIITFFAALLILMAFQTLLNNEEHWQFTELDTFDDFRTDFGIAAVTVIGGLILFTMIASFIDIPKSQRPKASSTNVKKTGGLSDVNDSQGIRPPLVSTSVFYEFQYSGLPREHLINLPPKNADVIVMTVQVQDTAPQSAQNYYWRSLTYDVYNGHGWGTSEIIEQTYLSGDELNQPNFDSARIVRQTVNLLVQLGPLAYAAGEVITIDQNFKVAWYKQLDVVQDVFAIHIKPDSYTVDSILPVYGKDRLREADANYPDWVIARYLALPDSIPERVISLAQDLTANSTNPYDKAKALESYLRTFEYTLEVPPAPIDQDIADYFLFDLQRGYCDYYATSMVVMARSVGIPARLAVGYNSGTYDEANDRYFVAAINAHSWVEVYFPNIGWVNFEPTAGIAPIELPSKTPQLVFNFLIPPWQQIAGVALKFSIMALGLGFGFLALWWLAEPLRLKKLPGDIYFQKIYQKIYKYGQHLQIQVPKSATPIEFYNGLYARIRSFGYPDGRHSDFIQDTLDALEQLNRLYVHSQYAQESPNDEARSVALTVGRKLQARLRVIILRNKMRDFAIKKRTLPRA